MDRSHPCVCLPFRTHRVSDPVIRRFSPLPAKGEGLWSTVVDYQRSVLIQVLEGEARAGEAP